jgi:predicted GNAT superfamily acetyltransferase
MYEAGDHLQRKSFSMSIALRWPTVGEQEGMVALNNDFAVETSVLTAAAMDALIRSAFFVRVAGETEAFCIALDQNAGYHNPNFDWFCGRLQRFVYIDRVVVAERARGRGLARAMYHALRGAAKEAAHTVLCCEVNVDPPNLASDRFHQGFGFSEIGRALLPDRGKTVRYLTLGI